MPSLSLQKWFAERADTLNEIFSMNHRVVGELARVSRTVGKEGKISQRATIGSATGESDPRP